MENNSLKEIWKFLTSKKKIALVLHPTPDGDSVGSCTALKLALEQNSECKADIFSKDMPDDYLMETGYFDNLIIKESNSQEMNKYEAIVALDCGDKNRALNSLENPEKLEIPIINIDHHDSNPYYGKLNHVDKNSISACSIVLKLLKENNIKINKEIAEILLIGIITDSNFFRVGQNLNNAIADTKELIDLGADYKKVVNQLYKIPLKVKKYQTEIIKNLKVEGDLAYCIIDNKKIKELNVNPGEVSLGNKVLDDLKETSIYFVLSEREEGKIKCSLRSRDGNKYDVSKIALKFDGGGSKQAAGFITKKPMQEILNLILREIKNLKP